MANVIRIDTLKNGDFTKCMENGPGFRVVVWFAGCDLHCPGCHNEEAWDFNKGEPFTKDTINFIIKELESPHYQGLSILGGEPLSEKNAYDVYTLVREVRRVYGNKKDIWLWTGHTKENLDKFIENNYGKVNVSDNARIRAASLKGIFNEADVLVDGPFIAEKKNLNLQFRGSSNQRIIKLH